MRALLTTCLEAGAWGISGGLTAIVTHMKVQGHEQGSADLILAKMREATARGTLAAADAYPYLAGQTGLVALIIPGWAQDGGRDAMLKRFADPALRDRIVREAEEAMDKRFGGPGSVYFPDTKQDLTTVMQSMQVRAGEAVVRLLEQGNHGIIARFGIEADLVKILQYPATLDRVRLRSRGHGRHASAVLTGRSRAYWAATSASSRP